MTEITIPYNFGPRVYQVPFLRAIDDGCKRLIIVWHRRTGKDKTCLNAMIKQMLKRVGGYYYMFPTLVQGRAVLWDGIDNDGFKFLDHFPPQIVKRFNNQEMKIELNNGSIFRVLGADNFDGKMGTNPVMIVFSEYSLINPSVWGFFRPILAANDGIAVFNFTPRGENHAYDLYNLGDASDDWYTEILTASDTKILSADILERERREIKALNGDDALYWQEYFCDFSVPIAGAYYANQMQDAVAEGRICNIPYVATFPVETYWDIGRTDYTAIWFVQRIGADIRLIDYLQTTGVGIHEIAPLVLSKKYVYSRHIAPHDIEQGEWGSAENSRRDTAQKLGINFEVAPMLSVQDGIDAARAILSRCWFDREKCADGISALKSYHKKYDEKRKYYQPIPEHDWSSHASDAFRYLAVSIDDRAYAMPNKRDRYKRARSSYQYTGNPLAV